MAWTYDPTLASTRDQVRLAVGDTDDSDPQLQDEELDAMLSMYGGVKSTAIAVCHLLAAKYARYADKWVGDLKILASQKHKAYIAMATALSSTTAATPAAPSAGGIYVDEKQAQEEDDSLVKPTFKRGFTDNETD